MAKRDRTAVGLDLDREVLAWGTEHNLAPLGDRASFVQLLRQDVQAPCRGRFDVSVALNFSYFIFRTREDLQGYFTGVRRTMAKDGIFVLDAYGGYESWRPKGARGGYVTWPPYDRSHLVAKHRRLKGSSGRLYRYTHPRVSGRSR